MAKGNIHANSIRQWCDAVDKRYKDFSVRLDKYRHKLEAKLGVKEEVSGRVHVLFSNLLYLNLCFDLHVESIAPKKLKKNVQL